MVNSPLLFIHTPHRFAELPCLRGAVPSGGKADRMDSSPKVGEVPFRAEGYEQTGMKIKPLRGVRRAEGIWTIDVLVVYTPQSLRASSPTLP